MQWLIFHHLLELATCPALFLILQMCQLMQSSHHAREAKITIVIVQMCKLRYGEVNISRKHTSLFAQVQFFLCLLSQCDYEKCPFSLGNSPHLDKKLYPLTSVQKAAWSGSNKHLEREPALLLSGIKLHCLHFPSDTSVCNYLNLHSEQNILFTGEVILFGATLLGFTVHENFQSFVESSYGVGEHVFSHDVLCSYFYFRHSLQWCNDG